MEITGNLVRHIKEEAAEEAQRITTLAEDQKRQLVEKAKGEGKAEGERRAEEVISRAQVLADRKIDMAKSLYEVEARDMMTNARNEILEEVFEAFSQRITENLISDKSRYKRFITAVIGNIISSLGSSRYGVRVSKGEKRLFVGRGSITKAFTDVEFTVSEDPTINHGFVIEALDTSAIVDFKLENYIQNIREEVMNRLYERLFR